MVPDPLWMKQREHQTFGVEGGEVIGEIIFQARADDQRGEERDQKQQRMQPVGPFLRRRRNQHLGKGRNLKSISNWRRGIRHLLLFG